jgi:hypothetical protein
MKEFLLHTFFYILMYLTFYSYDYSDTDQLLGCFNLCLRPAVFNEKTREKSHSEDPGVDGRIILRWIFRNWDGRAWTESMWLRIGTVVWHL